MAPLRDDHGGALIEPDSWRGSLEHAAQVAPEYLCPECERVFASGYERCPFDGSRLVNMGAGLAPGTVIDNRYTIKRLLGKGGMGSVYVGRQHSMDRDVAIKIMHHRADGNHASVQRFFWEVRAARRLQSPHTISVFDFGQTERASLYLVMELLKGTTLGHLLSVEQRIRTPLALRIGIQVCRSLEEAHAKSIIHRDLKPENIFIVQRANQSDFVKVLDFGVAKFLDPDGQSALTQTGTVFGTPRYMSPEQANSEAVDARSDLYSLGIMMYEMLTGKVPFTEENALELLYKQVHAKPVPVGQVAPWLGLDPAVGEVVDALLEKRREDRPQSATQVREALEELLARMPSEASVPPPLPMRDPPTMTSDADAPPARVGGGTADTQQSLDAREFLRREMPTPSLGTRRKDASSDWPVLAGRKRVVETARAAIDEALTAEQGRFVVISGERGVGKNRLASWLVAGAQKDRGALLGQARTAAGIEAMMPEIRSALDHLLGVTLLERTALRECLEDHPAFSDKIDRLLIEGLVAFLRPPVGAGDTSPSPDPAPADGGGGADAPGSALVSAIHRLLVRVSKLQPILLDVGVLNAAHPTTLRFIEYLASSFAQTPARIAVLARIETSPLARHQVLEGALELAGWRGPVDRAVFRPIVLERLDDDDFAAFLESQGKVYVHLIQYLRYLSGGNPHVASSLMRRIEEQPERLQGARSWRPFETRVPLSELPVDLVDGADRLIATALERAPDARLTRELLRRAAVIGERVEIGFLERLLEREGREDLLDTLEEILDALVDATVLLEGDDRSALTFANGVLREVVLGRVRSQRALQKLHGEVAALLEEATGDEGDRAMRLAAHHEAAGNIDAALRHRLRNARGARADGTPEEALSAFTSALAAVDALRAGGSTSPELVAAEREVTAEMASLHAELGLYEPAAEAYRRLLDVARTEDDALAVARAERGLAEVQDALAEYGAAIDLFRAAADRFRANDAPLDAAWCDLRGAASLERRGNVADARNAYQQARQAFARYRDQKGLAAAYNALGMLSLSEGDAQEALRQLRRAVDLFSKLDARLELGKALFHLALAATERRDLLMALDAANKALEIFDKEDFRTGISQCLGTIARVLTMQRRPAEARPYYERALRTRENLGDRRGVGEAVAALAEIALALDQPERALELAFRARDIYGSCGEFLGAAVALKTMGVAQRALGRHDKALAYLREAVATYESLSARDAALCEVLLQLAECEHSMGLRSEARETLETAVALARELKLTHQIGHLEARLRTLSA